MAFERARKEADPTKIELALDVVRISVIAIVFLAPLGAIGMMTSGPCLLSKISIEEHQRERELSYIRIIALQPVRTRKKTKKLARGTVTVHNSLANRNDLTALNINHATR